MCPLSLFWLIPFVWPRRRRLRLFLCSCRRPSDLLSAHLEENSSFFCQTAILKPTSTSVSSSTSFCVWKYHIYMILPRFVSMLEDRKQSSWGQYLISKRDIARNNKVKKESYTYKRSYCVCTSCSLCYLRCIKRSNAATYFFLSVSTSKNIILKELNCEF